MDSLPTEKTKTGRAKYNWLNSTVLGIGLASLFSDWSHEMATAALPAFLGTLGAAAVWLGIIEGVADGLSSFAKMASGYYTDGLQRRKPIAVVGYLVTALATASFAFAGAAWQLLIARSVGWLGRGVRTPVRKALLAAAVQREAYGRAFGLERMMDTLGAIVGPASALLLLSFSDHNYRILFAVTLIPGLLAAGVIGWLVKEKKRHPVPHITFGERLKMLPVPYRRFVVAVGIFGMGAFSHTLLILLATQKLTPEFGVAKAASIAIALYILHNVFYAVFAYVGGWFADRMPKKQLLATGYALAALMAIAIITLPVSVWTFVLVFMLGGIQIAVEETLEDSFCAELVEQRQHGMAFGVLATINGIGDFSSSIIVGILWTAFGTTAAFGYSAILFIIGAILVARLRPPQTNKMTPAS